MPKFRMSLFLCITLVLSLVVTSGAKALDTPHQVSHNRFLKKRVAAPQLIGLGGSDPQPVNGAGANPPTLTSEATHVVSTATEASSTPTPSTSTSSSTSTASTSTASSGSVASGLSTTTSSVSSSSSISSSSSTQSTSSSVAQSSDVPPITATPVQVASTSQKVVFVTNTASASASATPSSLSSSSTGITHTALIILIVVAASIGGSVIIWTIIRKWKFGKSSSFDDRMQPIDWQPTNDDGAIPGMNRRHSNASSFHSGSGMGHGGPSTAVVDPIPDHDFTAGPAHLAPVGGYADLARGPSPQPMMHELARGPSFSRQYQSDPYGVPLHHGGYGTGY